MYLLNFCILRKKLKYTLKKLNLYKYYFLIRYSPSLLKYINVILMMVIFFIKPSKLYLYSWRKCLPSEKMKDEHKDNIFEIYKPKVVGNFDFDICNRNLYTRGYTKKISFKKKPILINFEVDDENKDAIFTTSDERYLNYYLEKNVEVIFIKVIYVNRIGIERATNNLPKIKKKFKMLTLYIKTNNENTKHVTTGSAINSIITYYLISKKLNVYGWNFYHTKRLSSMNLIEFTTKIFFRFNDHICKDYVEYSLTHLYFANYFKNLKNLKIDGNLDYFKNKFFNKLFTPKIQQIFLYK